MDEQRRAEGQQIVDLMQAILGGVKDYENIIDDELTKGRIRTIFIQVKYGQKKAKQIADYYDIPVTLVKDIVEGKIFRKITLDLIE